MHGTRMMSKRKVRQEYGREVVMLKDEGRWVFLNTLFSVSEACIYMQVSRVLSWLGPLLLVSLALLLLVLTAEILQMAVVGTLQLRCASTFARVWLQVEIELHALSKQLVPCWKARDVQLVACSIVLFWLQCLPATFLYH